MFTRVLDAAKKFNIDDILEICGDCPMLTLNYGETNRNLLQKI